MARNARTNLWESSWMKRVPMVQLGHGVSLRHTHWQWQTNKGCLRRADRSASQKGRQECSSEGHTGVLLRRADRTGPKKGKQEFSSEGQTGVPIRRVDRSAPKKGRCECLSEGQAGGRLRRADGSAPQKCRQVTQVCISPNSTLQLHGCSPKVTGITHPYFCRENPTDLVVLQSLS